MGGVRPRARDGKEAGTPLAFSATNLRPLMLDNGGLKDGPIGCLQAKVEVAADFYKSCLTTVLLTIYLYRAEIVRTFARQETPLSVGT